MAYIVKTSQDIAVKAEAVEGTYQVPTVGSDFLAPLSDGISLEPSQEFLDRDILTTSIGRVNSRIGMRSVTGSLGCEFRAAENDGYAPEFDVLLEAGLGAKRYVNSDNTVDGDEITTTTGHATTYLNVTDSSLFEDNDIIVVKESGAYHVTPITVTSPTRITMMVAMAGAATDAVKIAKCVVYKPDNSGFSSFSVSRYLENAVIEKATGCRTNSIALSNWTTGQIPTIEFGFEGIDFDRDLGTRPVTADLQDSLPPVTLSACVWKDGATIEVTELNWSIDNTLGWITTTCSESGRVASRISMREVSGSITTYQDSTDNSVFEDYRAGTSFSLFSWSGNPTAVAGEFDEIVAMYIPECISESLSEADSDGTLQYSISFKAQRGTTGSEDEIILAFS